jgi:hypothetical protein
VRLPVRVSWGAGGAIFAENLLRHRADPKQHRNPLDLDQRLILPHPRTLPAGQNEGTETCSLRLARFSQVSQDEIP